LATTAEIELRPLRPADRTRVAEICRDVWDGNDYILEVFDAWVADPSARFDAAEVDGFVVGFQRLRPLEPGVLWYEGLRVASSHRRLGVARAMLRAAIHDSREAGEREIRLATANPDAIALFESEGFRLRVAADRWEGFRLEGDEPARIATADEAAALAGWLQQEPAFAAYGGIAADFGGAWSPATPKSLAREAEAGRLRLGPGGRALAAVRPRRWHHLQVTYLAGAGGALDDLLLRLRFEADADDLDGVIVWAPAGHPASGQFKAAGYDSEREPGRLSIYALAL
jgi:ribosomal protein S18 acetylase RimI-like enzyme